MKQIFITILLFLSISVYSQSEKDFQLVRIINEERMLNAGYILELYDNYTDLEYFDNYTLRLENSSDKEIKRCMNHINHFIEEYYKNASQVYYAAVCSKEEPTPESLVRNLVISDNFPYDGSTHVMPKMITRQLKDKWVGFIYVLTFDL